MMNNMLTPKQIETIRNCVEDIECLLHGLEPEIVGAILADIAATWLAGWQGESVEQVREEILQMHTQYIRELIPVNERLAAERKMMEQKEEGKLQ